MELFVSRVGLIRSTLQYLTNCLPSTSSQNDIDPARGLIRTDMVGLSGLN